MTPIIFEVFFEALEPLRDTITWRIIYFGYQLILIKIRSLRKLWWIAFNQAKWSSFSKDNPRTFHSYDNTISSMWQVCYWLAPTRTRSSVVSATMLPITTGTQPLQRTLLKRQSSRCSPAIFVLNYRELPSSQYFGSVTSQRFWLQMVVEPEMRRSEADINQLNVMNQKQQIVEGCLPPATQ